MSTPSPLEMLRARAEAGDAVAMRELAEQCHDADLEDEAMTWWRLAAEAGDAESAFNLGSMLEDDNPRTALAWYEQAALAGLTEAKVNAGALLAEEGSFERAALWWASAAEDGDADAMHNLGQLADRTGQAEQAERWWLQAARLGLKDALHNLVAQCEDLHAAKDPRAASLANIVLAMLAETGIKATKSQRRTLEQLASD